MLSLSLCLQQQEQQQEPNNILKVRVKGDQEDDIQLNNNNNTKNIYSNNDNDKSSNNKNDKVWEIDLSNKRNVLLVGNGSDQMDKGFSSTHITTFITPESSNTLPKTFNPLPHLPHQPYTIGSTITKSTPPLLLPLLPSSSTLSFINNNNSHSLLYKGSDNDDYLSKIDFSLDEPEEVQDMLNPINKIFKHNKKHKKDINTTSAKTTTNLIESKNNQNQNQNQPCQQQQQQQQQQEEDQLQPCQQGEPSSTESTPPNESIISEINNNIKNNNKSPEMESGITEEKYYKQHPIDDDDDSIYASPTSSTSSIISSASSTVNTPVPSPSSSPMYLTLSSADSPLPSLSSILGPISFSDSSENPDIPLTTVLKGIVVEDLDGNEVLLTDLWAKKRCIIAVFRRFGCLVCRLQALDLSSIKPKLDQLGIQMIGIGFDPTGLAEFIHGQFFQGTIYLDRTRAIHRSLCLKRMGFWDSAVGFTDPRLTVYRKRAKDIGLPHNFKGDGMQLGATLVIGPQPQDAHYDFRQRGFTDIFDLNQILKACKNPLPQKTIQKERYKLPAPIHLPCSPIHFNLELKPKNNNYNNNNNNSISQPKKTIYHFGNKDYHLTTKEQQPQQKEIDPQLLQKVEELSNQLLSTGIKNFDDVFNIPTIENFIKNVHISNNNNNIIVNNNKNNNKKNDKKHKLSNNSKLWMKLEPETDLIYLPY